MRRCHSASGRSSFLAAVSAGAAAGTVLCSSLASCLAQAPVFASSPSAHVAQRAVRGSSAAASAVKLYGEIDELSYICSAAGVKIQGKSLPSRIAKISLGSAASYSGLREDDRVIDARVEDNVIELTIERKGRRYQARIATDVKGLRSEFESRKIPFSFGDSPFDKEMKTISQCDVVLLLDRCLSMDDRNSGCPGDLSKWMWCKQQIDSLFLATDRVLDGGFNLVLFNSTYQSRNGSTLFDLKEIFSRIKPEGIGKNISLPVKTVMDDYFRRRKPDSKPLLVMVITDGLENRGDPLQDVLIEESAKMKRQGEVIVSFLQVGQSISAEDLFDDLDRNLVSKGARYHMVNYKPFAEVRNKGLLWELLACVHEALQNAPKSAFSAQTK